MPADALPTLGARASAGMVSTPKARIFSLPQQKSWLCFYMGKKHCYYRSTHDGLFFRMHNGIKMLSYYRNSSVDTDGLVLQHHVISINSVGYALM